jgi:predicted nucleotidyltransferase
MDSIITGVEAASIREVAAEHGATRIRIFGSLARGTAKPDSDLDLLVDLQPGRDLLDLIAIKQDLEQRLGRRVDVVTERSLSPYLRDQVLKEAVAI